MKFSDSHDEIGDLLRSHKPQVETPPGLETRILRSLEPRERSWMSRFWPWLLLPPAMAMVVLLLQPSPTKTLPVTQTEPPRPAVVEKPVAPASTNPLENESLALERDARRAGRFLISCLPSLGDHSE